MTQALIDLFTVLVVIIAITYNLYITSKLHQTIISIESKHDNIYKKAKDYDNSTHEKITHLITELQEIREDLKKHRACPYDAFSRDVCLSNTKQTSQSTKQTN
jgi:hypothetical protein